MYVRTGTSVVTGGGKPLLWAGAKDMVVSGAFWAYKQPELAWFALVWPNSSCVSLCTSMHALVRCSVCNKHKSNVSKRQRERSHPACADCIQTRYMCGGCGYSGVFGQFRFVYRPEGAARPLCLRCCERPLPRAPEPEVLHHVYLYPTPPACYVWNWAAPGHCPQVGEWWYPV